MASGALGSGWLEMKSQHGGKRKGAGKPAQFEKPMKRKEIMLPDEAIEFFLALGNGNLSAGVRKAWRSLTPLAPDSGYAPAKKAKSKKKAGSV